MALVFISPKKRKKILVQIITVFFVFFLIVFSLLIFLKPPEDVLIREEIFDVKEADIDFKFLESDKLNELILFEERVKREFDYTAKTEGRRDVEGRVLSFSEKEAIEKLKELGLEEIEVKERQIGRIDPFVEKLEEELDLILEIRERIENLEEIIGEDKANELLELEKEFKENPQPFWDLTERIKNFPELVEELTEELIEEYKEEIEE